jgi:hypothetical protein
VVSGIRVWAEQHGDDGDIIVTWERPDSVEQRDPAADERAVAAAIGVLRGVSGSEPAEGGVIVHFDPAVTSRQEIAAKVRAALTEDTALRARANEMMKRAPAYASLAASLALDERVSPVPEAARQAANRRAVPTRAMALRAIPGFPMIAQVYALLPMLKALSSWSHEASPEVVEEHLAKAGLTRDLLERDQATAQESLFYARAYTAESAAKVAEKATAAAQQAREMALQAREAAREWAEKRNTPPPPSTPRRYEP